MNDVPPRNAPDPLIDPVTLEVLRNALESIADEMGAVLKRTAFSPNIKERMDASCAIFDTAAQLVAQAEHVPVHLGSMLRSVEATIAAIGAVEEGDVVIVNDPFTGGSHLPDITLVAPVYVDDSTGTSAMSRRGRTTPMSAAWSRARCRATAARSTRRVW